MYDPIFINTINDFLNLTQPSQVYNTICVLLEVYKTTQQFDHLVYLL